MKSPDLIAAIEASGLRQTANLRRLVRTGLFLEAHPETRKSRRIGGSRLGGRPDLPNDFAWPRWKNRDLAFLAQIDLAELPAIADRDLLPQTGRLLFFYDVEEQPWGFSLEERGCASIRFDETPVTGLKPASSGPADDLGLRIARFEPVQTVPDFSAVSIESLRLSPSERDLYIKATESAIQEAGWFEGDDEDGYDYLHPLHQVLGHPRTVQHAMEWDCERVRAGHDRGLDSERARKVAEPLKAEADQWALLLQLDSDDRLGWQWGDVGRIYYWVRRDDLTARRFDQSLLMLQCS